VSLTSVKEYFAPHNEAELLALLETYHGSALLVAGGSFVHGLDARGLLLGIEALIDIRNLGLNHVTSDKAGLSIGAMVTFTELEQLEEVQSSAALGAVRDALKYPPLQIRNVATVGGNIAAACPYFDLPTAFMSLDAVVKVHGPDGQRDLDLQEMMVGLFQNALEPNELVTGLFLPRLPARSSSAFMKLETNANDLAIVNVAVRISLDPAGKCLEARVAVGGGGAETAVRVMAAERLLQGQTISDELVQKAGAAVQSDLHLMSDHRASGAYRSAMAKTLTERTLRQALGRL
jgi:aerobic carbon-monoxide dehydrogenase medium subunit